MRQILRRFSKILLTIYRSWIYHYLSYSINVWGQAANTYYKEAVIIYHRMGGGGLNILRGGVSRYQQSIKKINLKN